MSKHMKLTLTGICIALGSILGAAYAEPGDKIAPGDMFPAYQLKTMAGEMADSSQHEGKVVVLIYIVAKQRGSERAVADASKVIKDLGDQPIELLFVTANADQSVYFAEFWKEKAIAGTLAFDPDRTLYAKLGLIAFPTTLIIDPKGIVEYTLSTHSPNYPHVIDGYIRHALGLLDDAGLEEHLKARSLPTSSPKSITSRHRAVARLMREKGLYETAEKELLEALEQDSESLDIRLDLADLYLYLDRLTAASDYIAQVQKIDARHRHAMLLKGILLFHQGNYDQAQRILTKALILNPDPARTHYYLGRIYEVQENKDQALYHYRQALQRLLDEPADKVVPASDLPPVSKGK